MAGHGKGLSQGRQGVHRVSAFHCSEIWVSPSKVRHGGPTNGPPGRRSDATQNLELRYELALVFINMCTRFVFLYPLRTRTGHNVSEALQSLCASFGKPLRIQTDNGSEFKNMDMATICGQLCIEHFTTSYCPQGNGAAERVIRSLKENLNASSRGDTSSWPRLLPMV